MIENQIIDILVSYFSVYGIIIVFTILLLENLFLLGLVVPGETVLLIAAAAAARDDLNIYTVAVTAIAAATIGNTVGYFIGRKGGRPLIEKYGRRFVSEERIMAAEKYFDEHGTKTVFVGRFAAGVRTFVPLLAGAAKMSFSKFLAYTVAAVILWTIGVSVIGFFFGQNLDLITDILSDFGIIVLVIIILFVVYIVRRRRAQATHGNSGNN